MSTIKDIIFRSLRILQVIDYDESSIETSMEQSAVSALENIISSVSADPLLQYDTIINEFNLISGKYEYTIGYGEDFDTKIPLRLIYSLIRKETNYDNLLEKIAEKTYFSISEKQKLGLPGYIFFKKYNDIGKIYLWPTPKFSTYKLIISSYKNLIDIPITSVDEIIDLPSPYIEYFTYSLVLSLAPEYAVMPTDMIIANATNAKNNIKTLSPENETPIATFTPDLYYNARDWY